MAEQKMNITINGEDDLLDIHAFINVVKNTVNILKGVDQQIGSTDTPSIHWRIEHITMASPLNMTIVGEPVRQDPHVFIDVVSPFINGIREIESDLKRPNYFTDESLVKAKKLVSALNSGLVSIVFSAPDEKPVSPTQNLASNVDQIIGLRPPHYSVYSELQGVLGQITVHNKVSEFCIFDPITDDKIHCKFNPEQAEEIGHCITHRIRVSGKTKYNREDKPVSVEVESYKLLPDQKDLPQLKDIHALGVDITKGESSENYIKKIRDGDE